MAYVDLWVMVDVSDDKKIGTWYGVRQTISPEDDLSDKFAWIRIKDTDVLWEIESWNFDQSPLPKKYRGLAPQHHTYNFETASWSHVPVDRVTWKNIKDERMAKLNDTDWVVVKYTELGQPIPQEWLEYRTFLRNYPETHKHLSAEHAQHILNFTFDPDLQRLRASRGASIEPPEWIEEQ